MSPELARNDFNVQYARRGTSNSERFGPRWVQDKVGRREKRISQKQDGDYLVRTNKGEKTLSLGSWVGKCCGFSPPVVTAPVTLTGCEGVAYMHVL